MINFIKFKMKIIYQTLHIFLLYIYRQLTVINRLYQLLTTHISNTLKRRHFIFYCYIYRQLEVIIRLYLLLKLLIALGWLTILRTGIG
jgi:hypothetical protein